MAAFCSFIAQVALPWQASVLAGALPDATPRSLHG
jgi:hypothetical protein